jgi:hypothetical protein
MTSPTTITATVPGSTAVHTATTSPATTPWATRAMEAWLAAAEAASVPITTIDYQSTSASIAGRVEISGAWYDIIGGSTHNTVTAMLTPSGAGEFSSGHADTDPNPQT